MTNATSETVTVVEKRGDPERMGDAQSSYERRRGEIEASLHVFAHVEHDAPNGFGEVASTLDNTTIRTLSAWLAGDAFGRIS